MSSGGCGRSPLGNPPPSLGGLLPPLGPPYARGVQNFHRGGLLPTKIYIWGCFFCPTRGGDSFCKAFYKRKMNFSFINALQKLSPPLPKSVGQKKHPQRENHESTHVIVLIHLDYHSMHKILHHHYFLELILH